MQGFLMRRVQMKRIVKMQKIVIVRIQKMRNLKRKKKHIVKNLKSKIQILRSLKLMMMMMMMNILKKLNLKMRIQMRSTKVCSCLHNLKGKSLTFEFSLLFCCYREIGQKKLSMRIHGYHLVKKGINLYVPFSFFLSNSYHLNVYRYYYCLTNDKYHENKFVNCHRSLHKIKSVRKFFATTFFSSDTPSGL